MKITQNTDATDIEQSCLGLDCTRDTFPQDIRDHIHKDRGLHVQIRHNRDKQTFAQANEFARLMSAAPELLKIAKAFRNLLKTIARTEGQVATYQHIENTIAKAEGR